MCHQLRSSEDLPVVAFASVPDKEFVLVLCRDVNVQQDGDFLQTLPVRVDAKTLAVLPIAMRVYARMRGCALVFGARATVVCITMYECMPCVSWTGYRGFQKAGYLLGPYLISLQLWRHLY